mgnify:CR=1 FL=1
MKEVTDKEILKAFGIDSTKKSGKQPTKKPASGNSGFGKEVTDPEILAMFNNQEQQTTEPQKTSISEDIFENATSAPMELLKGFLELPEDVYESAKALKKNPFEGAHRASASTLSGLGEFAKGAYNLPLNINTYLGSKDVPGFKQLAPLAEKLKIGNTGLEKALLGDERAEDKLWKAIGSISPALKLAGMFKNIGTKAGVGAAYGAGQNENPFVGSLLTTLPVAAHKGIDKAFGKIRDISDIEQLKNAEGMADADFAKSSSAMDLFKQYLASRGMPTSAEGLMASVERFNNDIARQQENASIPFENTENLLPDRSFENLVPEAERMQSNILDKEIVPYLESFIEKGETPDVYLNKHIMKSVREIKDDVQRKYYKPLDKSIENKHVAVPRTADVAQIEADLKKMMGADFELTPGYQKVIDQFRQSSKGVDLIPTKDFMQIWRETRDEMYKSRAKSRAEGGDKKAFFEKQANELQQVADKQLELIEKSLPQEDLKLFKEGNNAWKEKVAPLYGNPVYEKAKKNRGLSSNIINDIRGTGKDQQILRNIIMENPESIRAALAQAFKRNPENIINPDKLTAPYVEALPQLQGMLQRLAKEKQNVESAKATAASEKARQEKITESFMQIMRDQQKRTQAIEETQRLQQQITERQNAAMNYERLERNERASERQRQEAKENRIRAEKEIKDAKKRLKFLAKMIASYAGAGAVINAITKTLF